MQFVLHFNAMGILVTQTMFTNENNIKLVVNHPVFADDQRCNQIGLNVGQIVPLTINHFDE